MNNSTPYFSETEYLVREKKHYLDASLYRGTHVIAFTICIKDRKQAFQTNPVFDIAEKSLLRSLEANTSEAIVYLFMPDHCHILAKGKDSESDMKKMILFFKQLTGFWFSQNMPDVFWQKDYYDHILRKEEEINKHIEYILLNPVRKQIVDTWHLYPFKGSTVYDLSQWEKDRSDFFSRTGLAG